MIFFIFIKIDIIYTAIKGVYENGTIKFLEPNVNKSEVLITFLNDNERENFKERITGGLLKLPFLKNKNLSIPDSFNDSIDDLKDCM